MSGLAKSRVALRNGLEIEDPLRIVLGLIERYPGIGLTSSAPPESFGEPDLRLANRGGARISAAEIAAILERRRPIERALASIAPDCSLVAPEDSVPWQPLTLLFEAFAGIRGVGFSKMTKALHPKRTALIPMLDSIVQAYLADDDPGPKAPFADRGLALTHGYKRDLDRNIAAMRAVCDELARHGHELTELRVLDLLIVSAQPAAG